MKNEKMRVGVIGAGAISDIYLQNMTKVFTNLEVVGVAAKHIENAQKKADQYGLKTYTVDTMLADDSIEMVVILTPVDTHYGLIKQALLAGKHVYTEKTITDSPEKAEELLQIAEEKGLHLGAAPDTFFGAPWQTARRIIDSGMIGDIHSFVISATRNNDVLLSILPFLRLPGAGILNDYGVYYVTALVSLLGPVKQVCGLVRTPYPTHINLYPFAPDYNQVIDTPNESQASAILQLESGITGTLHIDADSNMADMSYFAIYGKKGILYLTVAEQFGGEVKCLLDPRIPTVPPQPATLWQYTTHSDNSRGIGPSDMAAAIREGRPNRASKEMANHVLEVLTAIMSSSNTGSFQTIHSTCSRPEALPLKSIGAKNVGHTAFNMKNPEKMLDFYKNILGMQEVFSLTYGDLLRKPAEELSASIGEATSQFTPEELIRQMEAQKDEKWLTYLKLADGQFLELYYPNVTITRELDKQTDRFGYFKLNYEVDSIEDIRERMVRHGVELVEDIHTTIDLAREIVVRDPDGNTVQFTEYPKSADAPIPMPPIPEGHSCSHVQYTTQIAFDVHNEANMENFYCLGLGLKKVCTLYYRDLEKFMEQAGPIDPQLHLGMKLLWDKPWLDYIEVAPHQYIELFRTHGREPQEERNRADAYGYQHICIEVEDIHKAWDAVVGNGLKPDTEIALGPDGAYQFWLTDPDGNRVELMQYSENAKQLL